MVDGKGPTGGSAVEDPLGIDAATLELVEALGQVDGLLVPVADALDDPGLPVLQSVSTPSIERPDQAMVVRSLAVVARWRAGEGAVVGFYASRSTPDPEVAQEIGGEDVVVAECPLRDRRDGSVTHLAYQSLDTAGAGSQEKDEQEKDDKEEDEKEEDEKEDGREGGGREGGGREGGRT